jgi:hypothetical protein
MACFERENAAFDRRQPKTCRALSRETEQFSPPDLNKII